MLNLFQGMKLMKMLTTFKKMSALLIENMLCYLLQNYKVQINHSLVREDILERKLPKSGNNLARIILGVEIIRSSEEGEGESIKESAHFLEYDSSLV